MCPRRATDADAARDRLLHDLRNALSSLLTNAHLLHRRLPPDLVASRAAEALERDGARCADLLDALQADADDQPSDAMSMTKR